MRNDPNPFSINQEIAIHKRAAFCPAIPKNPQLNLIRYNTYIIYNAENDKKGKGREESYRNLEKETSSEGGRVSLRLGAKLPFFMMTL